MEGCLSSFLSSFAGCIPDITFSTGFSAVAAALIAEACLRSVPAVCPDGAPAELDTTWETGACCGFTGTDVCAAETDAAGLLCDVTGTVCGLL